MKTKSKICKGTYRVDYFEGCGDDKFIYKYGLCRSCFMRWCFETDEGQEYYKNQLIPKGREKIKTQNKQENRESIKTLSDYKKELQTIINSIVRLIDSNSGCISCDHGWDDNWSRQRHAGHRLSVGSTPELRFNVFNIWSQCSICNNWKSGNEREYDRGLVLHHGESILNKVFNLRIKYPLLHITIPELKEAIIKSKTIKKNILNGVNYSREEINKKIGIYK